MEITDYELFKLAQRGKRLLSGDYVDAGQLKSGELLNKRSRSHNKKQRAELLAQAKRARKDMGGINEDVCQMFVREYEARL